MIFERGNVHDKQGTGYDQVDQGSEQCEEKTEKQVSIRSIYLIPARFCRDFY